MTYYPDPVFVPDDPNAPDYDYNSAVRAAEQYAVVQAKIAQYGSFDAYLNSEEGQEGLALARAKDAKNAKEFRRDAFIMATIAATAGVAGWASNAGVAGEGGAATLLGSEGADALGASAGTEAAVAAEATIATEATAAGAAEAAAGAGGGSLGSGLTIGGVGGAIVSGAKAIGDFFNKIAPFAGLVSTGLTIAEGVSSIRGQRAQRRALEEYQAQQEDAAREEKKSTTASALESFRTQTAQVDRRTGEEDRAAAADIRENQLRSEEAQGTAITAAGEAGVTGNSVFALLADFKRTEGAYNTMVLANRKAARAAAGDEHRALQEQAEGRVRSVPAFVPKPIEKPDYLGATLRIGAGLLDTGAKYYGWGKTQK